MFFFDAPYHKNSKNSMRVKVDFWKPRKQSHMTWFVLRRDMAGWRRSPESVQCQCLRWTRIHHVDKVVVRNSFYPLLEHWKERSLQCWRRRESRKLNDAGSSTSLHGEIYACEQWPAKRLFRAVLLFSFQVFLSICYSLNLIEPFGMKRKHKR